MTGPAAVVSIPAVGQGPSARLQLNDPATILGVIGTIGALLTKAIPALAGMHIDNLYPSVALLAVAVYDAWVVGKKHDLAGVLATAPSVITAVEGVGAAVDPQGLADLRAEVATLHDQVASIPVDQREAVLAALRGLVATGSVAPIPAPFRPADGPA